MKTLILIAMVFNLVACATNGTTKTSEPAPTGTAPAVTEPDNGEPSEILKKDSTGKKCPKKTKLVNGKCLMQVEETE